MVISCRANFKIVFSFPIQKCSRNIHGIVFEMAKSYLPLPAYLGRQAYRYLPRLMYEKFRLFQLKGQSWRSDLLHYPTNTKKTFLRAKNQHHHDDVQFELVLGQFIRNGTCMLEVVRGNNLFFNLSETIF